jgi:hypothetical protein
VRVIQSCWRPIAITACLLGTFWPVAQGAFLWAGVDYASDTWLFRAYFLDAYIAALVLGLIASRRAIRMALSSRWWGHLQA